MVNVQLAGIKAQERRMMNTTSVHCMRCGTELHGNHMINACSNCVGHLVEQKVPEYSFIIDEVQNAYTSYDSYDKEWQHWESKGDPGVEINVGSIMPYWGMSIVNKPLEVPEDQKKLLESLKERYPKVEDNFGVIPLPDYEWFVSVDNIGTRKNYFQAKSCYFGDKLGWTVPVPTRHPWESITTPIKRDEQFEPLPIVVDGVYDDGDGKPTTGPKGRENRSPFIGKLPRGTPYVMRYLIRTADGVKFGAYSNVELDARYLKVVDDNMRAYAAANYFPKLGRGSKKRSFPLGAYLLETVKTPEGRKTYIRYECDEIRINGLRCGGYYRLQADNTYVCEECGMTHDWDSAAAKGRRTTGPSLLMEDYLQGEDVPVDSDSIDDSMIEDNPEADNDDDESVEEPPANRYYASSEQLGSTLPPEIAKINARLEHNQKAWKKLMETAPADEVQAKAQQHQQAETDRRVRKDLAYGHRAIDVYANQEKARTTSHRRAAILHWLRLNKTMKSNELHRILIEHNTKIGDMKQLTRELDALEEEGRLMQVKENPSNPRSSLIITFIH